MRAARICQPGQAKLCAACTNGAAFFKFLARRVTITGPDPWQYGLTARNRKTLDTLVGFSFEQGLIPTSADNDP